MIKQRGLSIRSMWIAVVICQFLFSSTAGWAAVVKPRWQVDFDGSASVPVLAGGILYVGPFDGAVYAFDPNSVDVQMAVSDG